MKKLDSAMDVDGMAMPELKAHEYIDRKRGNVVCAGMFARVKPDASNIEVGDQFIVVDNVEPRKYAGVHSIESVYDHKLEKWVKQLAYNNYEVRDLKTNCPIIFTVDRIDRDGRLGVKGWGSWHPEVCSVYDKGER